MSINASVRPALLLSKYLLKFGLNTTIITPFYDNQIENKLHEYAMEIISINERLYSSGSLAVMESWIRNLRTNHINSNAENLIINMSSTIQIYPHIFYGQGPIHIALQDIFLEMPMQYKIVYKTLSYLFRILEKSTLNKIRKYCKFFLANSYFSKELYTSLGINVDKVIYPPLDTNRYIPGNNPREDYVLTYFGKETDYSIINTIAKSGVKMVAFGSKTPYIPRKVVDNPNINYLGRISEDQLIELYRNALYTLFAFTHEPFGYIPVESMACGTPVLTYAKQGPLETVRDNITGWLAKDSNEMIRKAIELWKKGYEKIIRRYCREYAVQYSIDNIAKEWLHLIEFIDNDIDDNL